VQLTARADVQLGEELAQVVLDRARGQEQPGANLRVRRPVAGQPGDLRLLGGQLRPGRDRVLASGLAGGAQFAPCPRGERLQAHLLLHLAGSPQLITRVDAAPLAAQPTPVQRAGAGQLDTDTVRLRCAIASRYRRSARCPLLSSASERA
jgi:hypothetical protein